MFLETLAGNVVSQGQSIDALHHEEGAGPAVLSVDPRVDQFRDPGMVQPLQQRDLALEPRPVLVIVHSGSGRMQHLEGESAWIPFLANFVHDAHSAHTEDSLNSIAPDRIARGTFRDAGDATFRR